MCSFNSRNEGSWLSAQDNHGKVVDLSCDQKQYVSDGSIWIPCNESTTLTIKNHEYMCLADRMQWKECCGTTVCNSNNAGSELQVGKFVNESNNIHYCLSNNKFSTNLDNFDKLTCEAANFTWTGTLCCSEAEDNPEYYNDVEGSKGGCWNKKAIMSGNFVPPLTSVINYRGQFFGCNLQDEALINLNDHHTNETLINNSPLCMQDSNRLMVCQHNGSWGFSYGLDKSKLSTTPPEFQTPVNKQTQCCSQTQCWNGSVCMEDQGANPNAPTTYGYRCIGGNWIPSPFKYTPDKSASGYCPRAEQCLVDPNGRANENDDPTKKPQCIANGQYIKDYFCENGNWTSRTKFVATKLSQLVEEGEDYTLFCDIPEVVLNYRDFTVQGINVELLLEQDTNNFCLISYEENIIVGTTLNEALNDESPLLEILGIDSCRRAYNNDKDNYVSCDIGKSRVWYNAKNRGLIFSTQDFALEPGIVEGIRNFVRKLWKSLFTNQSKNPSFLDDVYQFSKLYMDRSNGKEIYGILEDFDNKKLIVQYKGFETDICELVNARKKTNTNDDSYLECAAQDGSYYVISEGSEFSIYNPASFWNDLTSKVRLS